MYLKNPVLHRCEVFSRPRHISKVHAVCPQLAYRHSPPHFSPSQDSFVQCFCSERLNKIGPCFLLTASVLQQASCCVALSVLRSPPLPALQSMAFIHCLDWQLIFPDRLTSQLLVQEESRGETISWFLGAMNNSVVIPASVALGISLFFSLLYWFPCSSALPHFLPMTNQESHVQMKWAMFVQWPKQLAQWWKAKSMAGRHDAAMRTWGGVTRAGWLGFDSGHHNLEGARNQRWAEEKKQGEFQAAGPGHQDCYLRLLCPVVPGKESQKDRPNVTSVEFTWPKNNVSFPFSCSLWCCL